MLLYIVVIDGSEEFVKLLIDFGVFVSVMLVYGEILLYFVVELNCV